MKQQLHRLVSVTLVALFVAMPVISVSANETEQIQQLGTMLDEQDTLDAADAAKKDRQLARQWLQEAEVLLANGKNEAAKRRLRRVEFAVELVTALVAAALIRQKAEEQEASAYTAPEQMEQLQTDVDNLRKKKTELQTELSQLRQYQ